MIPPSWVFHGAGQTPKITLPAGPEFKQFIRLYTAVTEGAFKEIWTFFYYSHGLTPVALTTKQFFTRTV